MSETSNFEELYGKKIEALLKSTKEVKNKTIEQIHAKALPKITKDVDNTAKWLDVHACRINNPLLTADYGLGKDNLIYIKQGLKHLKQVEKQLSTLKLLKVEHTNRNNTVLIFFEKDCYIELTCTPTKTRFFKLIQRGKRLAYYSMLYRYKKTDSELEKEIKKVEVKNISIIKDGNEDSFSFSIFNMNFLEAYDIFYKTSKYLQMKTIIKTVEDMYEKEYDSLLEDAYREFDKIMALMDSKIQTE